MRNVREQPGVRLWECRLHFHPEDAEDILGELIKNVNRFILCQCWLFQAEADERFILFMERRLWFGYFALYTFSFSVFCF